MSENWKDEKTRDGPAGRAWLYIVREHQMLEKGEITQAELDRLMNKPLLEEADDEAKETILKIVLKVDPTATLDEIE